MEAMHYSYGCIMAMIEGTAKDKIVKLSRELISDDIIYDNKTKEYGREIESHITIKYGLTKVYGKKEVEAFLLGIKPFKVKICGIGIFENEDFDVVKLNVSSKELDELNEKFCNLPNEDKYKIYHPHSTLAYVKPGEGKKLKKSWKGLTSITIDKICYSNKGKKIYFEL